jgi:hypothetical protein
MRRTATLDQTNVMLALGVALAGGAVWTVLSLLTGMPLGFLALLLGGAIGHTLAQRTYERGPRLVGLVAGAALLAMVVARLGAAAFTGVGLMVEVILDDDDFHRRVVYAEELRTWNQEGRLPPALAPWLEDTSLEPDEKIATGLEDWLVKARKRFEQRTADEQARLYEAHAKRLLDQGGTFDRLGLFMGLVDLVWLAGAILAGGWYAMGLGEDQKTHIVQEVPQDRLTTFDDLDVKGFDVDDEGFEEPDD